MQLKACEETAFRWELLTPSLPGKAGKGERLGRCERGPLTLGEEQYAWGMKRSPLG